MVRLIVFAIFVYRRSLSCAVIPSLPIGLIGFAWTSLGPPKVPWVAPMIFSAIVGIGNVSGWSMQLEDLDLD